MYYGIHRISYYFDGDHLPRRGAETIPVALTVDTVSHHAFAESLAFG